MRSSFISVEEYLTHRYEPECEYVNGALIERLGFEFTHSRFKTVLMCHLHDLSQRTGIRFGTLPSLTMRLSESCYRIPDLMVLTPGYRIKTIALFPPALVIEILSKDDTWKHLVAKCQEYVSFGAAVTLVADPYERRVHLITEAGPQEVTGRIPTFPLGNTAVPIDFNRLFAELDRD